MPSSISIALKLCYHINWSLIDSDIKLSSSQKSSKHRCFEWLRQMLSGLELVQQLLGHASLVHEQQGILHFELRFHIQFDLMMFAGVHQMFSIVSSISVSLQLIISDLGKPVIATEAERNQILGHNSSKVFERNYLSTDVRVDLQGRYIDGKGGQEYINRQLSQATFQRDDVPHFLPDEILEEIRNSKGALNFRKERQRTYQQLEKFYLEIGEEVPTLLRATFRGSSKQRQDFPSQLEAKFGNSIEKYWAVWLSMKLIKHTPLNEHILILHAVNVSLHIEKLGLNRQARTMPCIQLQQNYCLISRNLPKQQIKFPIYQFYLRTFPQRNQFPKSLLNLSINWKVSVTQILRTTKDTGRGLRKSLRVRRTLKSRKQESIYLLTVSLYMNLQIYTRYKKTIA